MPVRTTVHYPCTAAYCNTHYKALQHNATHCIYNTLAERGVAD